MADTGAEKRNITDIPFVGNMLSGFQAKPDFNPLIKSIDTMQAHTVKSEEVAEESIKTFEIALDDFYKKEIGKVSSETQASLNSLKDQIGRDFIAKLREAGKDSGSTLSEEERTEYSRLFKVLQELVAEIQKHVDVKTDTLGGIKEFAKNMGFEEGFVMAFIVDILRGLKIGALDKYLDDMVGTKGWETYTLRDKFAERILSEIQDKTLLETNPNINSLALNTLDSTSFALFTASQAQTLKNKFTKMPLVDSSGKQVTDTEGKGLRISSPDEVDIFAGIPTETLSQAKAALAFNISKADTPEARTKFLFDFLMEQKSPEITKEEEKKPNTNYEFLTDGTTFVMKEGFTTLPTGIDVSKVTKLTIESKTIPNLDAFTGVTEVTFPDVKFDSTITSKIDFSGLEKLTKLTTINLPAYTNTDPDENSKAKESLTSLQSAVANILCMTNGAPESITIKVDNKSEYTGTNPNNVNWNKKQVNIEWDSSSHKWTVKKI